MNYRTFRGYVQAVVSGLVILAAALLVVLQWGNVSAFSLYGKNTQLNTGVLMLCSLAGGVVLYWLVRAFLRGALAIRRGRAGK